MEIIYEDGVEIGKDARYGYSCSQITMRGDKIDIKRHADSRIAEIRITNEELDLIYAAVLKMRAMKDKEHLLKD